MKKYINQILNVLIIWVISSNVYAQGQSLRELLGDQHIGTTDSLVIKAISPALSVIRQQYRLKRNNDFYGKNNMPYYGETYSLGVKVSGGTIIQNSVVTPWIGDADYDRVNKSGKYQPVLFWSKQRGLNDSIYTPVELELNTQYTQPIGNDSLLYLHSDIYSDFGLSIRNKADKHSGYMIWVYADSSTPDSTLIVNLKQKPLNLVIEEDSNSMKLSTEDLENVMGGVFVEPYYERGGRVQLVLVGVAAKNLDNEWLLTLVSEPAARISNVKDNKAKQKSKNDKSKTSDSDPTPIKSPK